MAHTLVREDADSGGTHYVCIRVANEWMDQDVWVVCGEFEL